MFKKRYRPLSLSVLLLALVCVFGFLLAGQRYYTLKAIEDIIESQEAIDNSFLVSMKYKINAGGDDPTVGLKKSMTTHLDQSRTIREALAKLSLRARNTQLGEIALWSIAFLVTLIVFSRAPTPPKE
jgi:hypothetical protein